MFSKDSLNASFDANYPYYKPRLASIGLTGRCNARCKYCTDWRTNPDPSLDQPYSRIVKILEEIKDLGVEEVIFSGGEPLLRKDIFDLIEYGKSIGLNIRIITNGTALTEWTIHRLASLGIMKLGVSIDSLNEARFLQARGLNLQKVLTNLSTVAKIRDSFYSDLFVSLYVTIHRLNIQDLLCLCDYAEEKSFSIQFQPVHYQATGIQKDIFENLWPGVTEIEDLEKIIQEIIKRKEQGRYILSRIDFLMQIPTFFKNKTVYPQKCYVGYTDVVIDQNLNLRPCWSMEPIEDLKNCNLTIKEIWISDKMKETRKIIKEKKCPGCLYSCHLNKDGIEFESTE